MLLPQGFKRSIASSRQLIFPSVTSAANVFNPWVVTLVLTRPHPIVHCSPPRFDRRRSKGMDQQKAGEEHHRAGYAMNGERCGLPAARHKNVGHVSKRDDGENQENYAYCPAAGREHQGQHCHGS